MPRILGAFSFALLLSSCATPPPPDPPVWVRTDGQSTHDNPAFQQQFEIDETVCRGQAQQAGMSAAPVYTNNIIDAAIVANVRQGQITDVVQGCMASRGYILVPTSQAAAKAAELRAAAQSGALGTRPAGSAAPK